MDLAQAEIRRKSFFGSGQRTSLANRDGAVSIVPPPNASYGPDASVLMLRVWELAPQGPYITAQGNALGLILRVFDFAPMGHDKSAQGNALGLMLRVFDFAPKGPYKIAQGNALGSNATRGEMHSQPTASPERAAQLNAA
jgi:hypothetical protein